jgi:hypothetical protein
MTSCEGLDGFIDINNLFAPSQKSAFFSLYP